MIKKIGLVSEELVEKHLPSEERRAKGPYAVFECFQEIPCNPCFTSCNVGAVEMPDDINTTPKINYDKCTGCGLCISACPGLACFVIDETYSDTETTIKIPYEFLPIPEVGEQVSTLDRQGNVVGKAKVVQVQKNKKLDCTNVITLAVPKSQAMIVRNMRMGG